MELLISAYISEKRPFALLNRAFSEATNVNLLPRTLRSLSVQIMVVDHPTPAPTSICWHAASLTLHVEKMLITRSGTEGFDPLTWLTQLWLQSRKITAVARVICILYKYADPGDRSTWMLFQGTGIWKVHPCRVSLILSLLRNYHSRISIIFQSYFDFS